MNAAIIRQQRKLLREARDAAMAQNLELARAKLEAAHKVFPVTRKQVQLLQGAIEKAYSEIP